MISKRLGELKVTYKNFSVEAFSPRKLLREELFWTMGLPLGNVGIERRKLIDVDEFDVKHKWLNQSKGWGLSYYCVRMVENYTKNTNLTFILAIEAGDLRLPDEMEGSISYLR